MCGQSGVWTVRCEAVRCVDSQVCGQSGVWTVRCVDSQVCGQSGVRQSGVWTVRCVDSQVCGQSGVWTVRCVDSQVCGQSGVDVSVGGCISLTQGQRFVLLYWQTIGEPRLKVHVAVPLLVSQQDSSKC